jgi:alpha-tubulin suppressor-like RCC1 family protein
MYGIRYGICSRWLGRWIPAVGVSILAAACGDNPSAPTPAAPAPALASSTTTSGFWQVSSGILHTCAVTTVGRAFCWGFNVYGQLGDGTTQQRLKPTPVSGALVFRNISVASMTTCGVTTDNLAYCWGLNDHGTLGDGTQQRRGAPTRVAGGLRFRTVSTGSEFTCGLSEPDRRAYCWGSNFAGQLGDGTTADRHTPVPVAGGRRFRQIDAGATHTCAVTPTYQAYCWGSDDDGRLGDGSTKQNRSTPSLVAGGHQFSQISAGRENTCAVTTGYKAFCWGRGTNGDGTLLSRYTPRAVLGGISFERVTVGYHMCGESTTGKAYCWGFGNNGSLGNGSFSSDPVLSPVAVRGGLTFAEVSAGYYTCGKTPASVAYCWGDNNFGQLGDGTTQARPVPTRVLNPL